MVKNYAGLLVLRFLQGFLSSPSLANGGASVGDMVSSRCILSTRGQFMLTPWSHSLTSSCSRSTCLPGRPRVSGVPLLVPSSQATPSLRKGTFYSSSKPCRRLTTNRWRWSLWELVWMSAPILVLFLIAFPETSTPTILRRRAQRLRKLTGRGDLRSQSEIQQANMNVSSIFVDAVIKPVEIMVKDPAVAFTNVYVSLGLVPSRIPKPVLTMYRRRSHTASTTPSSRSSHSSTWTYMSST